MNKHVIVAGAQKAGTTTLHSILIQSNEVVQGLRKELHYFDKSPNPNYKDYLNHFDEHNKIMLDSTPSYIYNQNALNAIARIIPRKKIIVILRTQLKGLFYIIKCM